MKEYQYIKPQSSIEVKKEGCKKKGGNSTMSALQVQTSWQLEYICRMRAVAWTEMGIYY